MARIHRVDPSEEPGIRRLRTRGRFRYRGPDGRSVPAADRERIAALVIPPAWRDVWISPDPDGHIQAVGTDAAGRRQYLYHERWRTRRDHDKFERALDLAARMPQLRRRVTQALHSDDDHLRTLAAAVRMLDLTAIRIGSPRYLRRHGSRGLTTLRWADLRLRGRRLTLTFPGKSGKRQEITVEDDELRAWILAQPARPKGAILFRYRSGRRLVPLTTAEVSGFLRRCAGGRFTAKDVRTLRGTTIAAQVLAAHREAAPAERELTAVDAVAEVLGNTRAVARSSYIDSRVLTAARRGRFVDTGVSPETALLRLLGRDAGDS